MLFGQGGCEGVELLEEDVGHVLSLFQLKLGVFGVFRPEMRLTPVVEPFRNGQRYGLLLHDSGGGPESPSEAVEVGLGAQLVD